MKKHLEQQIAELFTELSVVAGPDRFVDLVRLLDQIGAQRLVRLGRVPLATLAQVAHQGERLFETSHGNREQGTGNREQGTGNREQGTGKVAPPSNYFA